MFLVYLAYTYDTEILICIKVRTIADQHNIPVHLDGARIINASVALGVTPKEVAAHADSVMISMSKVNNRWQHMLTLS